MQPTPRCPDCGAAFELRDIDVKKEVAACTTCGTVSPLSECFGAKNSKQPGSGPALADDDPSPPEGCRVTRTAEGVELVCSIRNIFAAIVYTGFSLLVWSWVGPALMQLPMAWIELPHSNAGALTPTIAGATTKWQLFMITLAILGFFVVGLATVHAAALYWRGHRRVQINAESCNIFTGVGTFEYTRRIRRADIRTIEEQTAISRHGYPVSYIEIKSEKKYKFAQELMPHRRQWLFAQIQKALAR